MIIEITIADSSDEEMTSLRQLSILILALQGCLAQFPEDERENIINELPELVRGEGT